jgi:hypothetical protein
MYVDNQDAVMEYARRAQTDSQEETYAPIASFFTAEILSARDEVFHEQFPLVHYEGMQSIQVNDKRRKSGFDAKAKWKLAFHAITANRKLAEGIKKLSLKKDSEDVMSDHDGDGGGGKLGKGKGKFSAADLVQDVIQSKKLLRKQRRSAGSSGSSTRNGGGRMTSRGLGMQSIDEENRSSTSGSDSMRSTTATNSTGTLLGSISTASLMEKLRQQDATSGIAEESEEIEEVQDHSSIVGSTELPEYLFEQKPFLSRYRDEQTQLSDISKRGGQASGPTVTATNTGGSQFSVSGFRLIGDSVTNAAQGESMLSVLRAYSGLHGPGVVNEDPSIPVPVMARNGTVGSSLFEYQQFAAQQNRNRQAALEQDEFPTRPYPFLQK